MTSRPDFYGAAAAPMLAAQALSRLQRAVLACQTDTEWHIFEMQVNFVIFGLDNCLSFSYDVSSIFAIFLIVVGFRNFMISNQFLNHFCGVYIQFE